MMGLDDILGGLLKPLKDIVSEVIVDKDKRDEINLEIARLEDEARARLDNLTLQQIETNKVEASHGSVFVAGWRPFVGWIGGLGFGYLIIGQPFLSWIAMVIFGYTGDFPVVDTDLLLYVLGGMLGLGGMRTYEKVKGVSTNTMTDVPGRVQDVTKEEVKVITEEPRKKKKFKIF